MRILAVRPGPDFSVADVHRGWVDSLARLGCQVVDYNLNDRLQYHERALIASGQETPDGRDIATLAAEGIEGQCFRYSPDVVLITSGFYVPPATWRNIKRQGIKIVLLATESPYEDDGQLLRAQFCDLVLLNDPTNLHKFRQVTRAEYIPHAYDPRLHRPGPADPDYKSDFAFIGSAYPSRIKFFEQVDWAGVDVLLGGHWHPLPDGHMLEQYLGHDRDVAISNDETVRVYQSTKMSANLYRQEAERDELATGWAMGPRELELAAVGTFFLRQHRPESDEVLPMLPTFTEPGEFGELMRWWLIHDREREAAAIDARRAVASRTFDHNATRLLRWVAKLPI